MDQSPIVLFLTSKPARDIVSESSMVLRFHCSDSRSKGTGSPSSKPMVSTLYLTLLIGWKSPLVKDILLLYVHPWPPLRLKLKYSILGHRIRERC
jgi:hypothetical protein